MSHAEIDATLASLEQIARKVMDTACRTLELPQSIAILDEIRASSRKAAEVLAYAEAGQWATTEAEKRTALGHAERLVRELGDTLSWIDLPIPELAFVHLARSKQ